MKEGEDCRVVRCPRMGKGRYSGPALDNQGKTLMAWMVCVGLACIFQAGETKAGTPAYSSVILADGPVAYWDFDDVAPLDSSGNGHDGTISGNVEFGAESFSENLLTGIELNGTDAFIKVPALGNFDQSTIEAWVKVDAINWRLLKDAGYLTSIFSTGAFGGGSHHLNIHLSLNIEQGIAGGGPNNIVSPNNTLRIGSWQHIVSTYDSTAGGVGRIYVNGVEVQSGAHGAAPKAVLGASQIGSWGGRRLLDGRIDEVAVYDTALNPSRIMAHFKAATAPPLKREGLGSRPARGSAGSGIEGSVVDHEGNEFTGRLVFESGKVRVSAVGGRPLSAGKSGAEATRVLAAGNVQAVRLTSVEAETVTPVEKLPPSRGRKVWLKGGSMVVGKLINIDSKSVILATGGGLTTLPRVAVAIIDMRWGTVEGQMLKGKPPGYLLQDRSFVEAKLEAMTEAGDFATWSPILGRQAIAPAKVRAVKFAEIKKPIAGSGLVISMVSGSIIHADSVISKGARLIVRDNSRYFLNIHASEVLEMRRPAD